MRASLACKLAADPHRGSASPFPMDRFRLGTLQAPHKADKSLVVAKVRDYLLTLKAMRTETA